MGTKKRYIVEDIEFKSKGFMDLYIELKEEQKNGLIETFKIPTIKDVQSKSKYNSSKCEVDKNLFHSIEEGRFYLHLLREKKEGKIISIDLQPKFILQEGFIKDGKKELPIHYIADFKVTYADGKVITYDVKGRETKDFLIKKKLFNYKFMDLTLMCVQYRATEGKWLSLDEIKRKTREKKSLKKKELKEKELELKKEEGAKAS